MPKSIKLTVPDEIAGTPFEKDYLETAQQFIKEQTVLRLYREHKISTGTGARMLGMSIFSNGTTCAATTRRKTLKERGRRLMRCCQSRADDYRPRHNAASIPCRSSPLKRKSALESAKRSRLS